MLVVFLVAERETFRSGTEDFRAKQDRPVAAALLAEQPEHLGARMDMAFLVARGNDDAERVDGLQEFVGDVGGAVMAAFEDVGPKPLLAFATASASGAWSSISP